MKPLILYPCLLAVLFQAIFSSTSSSDRPASLSSDEHASLSSEGSSGSMDKSVVGESVEKAPVASLKKKGGCKRNKSSVVVKEPKYLNELLPDMTLIEIVIGYFSDDTCYILVSTHDWLLKNWLQIAVDSSRLYVATESEGLKGLSHSSASLKEDERRCSELGNPHWLGYTAFSSSDDGRYVSFSHEYRAVADLGEQTEDSTKWLTCGGELENEKPKRVAFDGEVSPWGLMSRDGQLLFSYNIEMENTRVYQIKEETGKDPTASLKLDFNGMPRAVSGNGRRVIVERAGKLEIHDIGTDTSELVCRIDSFEHACALSNDGSEAAFVKGGELRIVQASKAVGDTVDRSAIITVKIPWSLGEVYQLVYSDENRLHLLRRDGSVSLFDPLKKALVPIETPQKGQRIICSAISPNAGYIATLQCVRKENDADKRTYRTTVKRKSTRADLMGLFVRKDDKEAAGQS